MPIFVIKLTITYCIRRILLQTMDKSHVSLKSYIEELKNTTERRLALKRKGLEFLAIIEQDALPDPVRLALDSNFLDKFISVTSEFTKEIDEIADLTPFCVLWSKYCSAIFQILTGRIDDMIMVNGALAFQQILEEYQKEASFYTSLRLVFSKHKDEELQHNFEFIECFGLGLPWYVILLCYSYLFLIGFICIGLFLNRLSFYITVKIAMQSGIDF